MNEKEALDAIKYLPVGAKLQIIKTNGDIIEVVLASQEITSSEMKSYKDVEVPALPPAITVQGGRWGTYRIDTEDIVKIARIG